MSAESMPKTRFARSVLWLIPDHGALLALGTIPHQADYETHCGHTPGRVVREIAVHTRHARPANAPGRR